MSGRSSSSRVNVDRNNSVTSSSATGEPILVRQSSSFATTLDRGDSYGSRASAPVPGPSSILNEKMALNFPDMNELMTMVPSSREQHMPLGLHEDYVDGEDDFYDYESDEDDSRFVDFSLLSHIAMRLRDKVPRETHVKGSIPYPRAFTGKDVVVSLLFLSDDLMIESSSIFSQQFSHKSSASC
jgi:hypothetical protein